MGTTCKPCPVCREFVRPIEDEQGWTAGHVCRSPEVGCTVLANLPTEAAAIEAWNEFVASVCSRLELKG